MQCNLTIASRHKILQGHVLKVRAENDRLHAADSPDAFASTRVDVIDLNDNGRPDYDTTSGSVDLVEPVLATPYLALKEQAEKLGRDVLTDQDIPWLMVDPFGATSNPRNRQLVPPVFYRGPARPALELAAELAPGAGFAIDFRSGEFLVLAA